MSKGLPDWAAGLSDAEFKAEVDRRQPSTTLAEMRSWEAARAGAEPDKHAAIAIELLEDQATPKAYEERAPVADAKVEEQPAVEAPPDYPWLGLVTCKPREKANLHRAIVFLRDHKGLSLREIATIVDTSRGNVANQLSSHLSEGCPMCKKSYLPI